MKIPKKLFLVGDKIECIVSGAELLTMGCEYTVIETRIAYSGDPKDPATWCENVLKTKEIPGYWYIERYFKLCKDSKKRSDNVSLWNLMAE